MNIRYYLNNKKGSSSIILLFMVIVVIGLTTFTVDAGLLYFEKGRLQNVVDSVALAAVSVYEEGEERMLEEAHKYSNLNGVPPEELNIDISEDRKRVTVTIDKTVPLYFARIFNRFTADVGVRAAAAAGSIVSAKGIRPFAVEQQEFEYGETYTLKEGAGGGHSGNYGALALGGSGAWRYRNNLINGYNANPPLRTGDEVETEPGNMAGPTQDGIQAILDSDPNEHSEDLSQLEANCPRLIVIPVVDSLDVHGRSTATIVGFAAFFLDDVVRNGGHTEITGRFIKKIGEGEIDESSEGYGLFGIKLVE